MSRKAERARVVKKSGFLGKILCLLLGLILGVAATVFGVVGAGYFVYTQPVDKTVNLIDKYVPADVYAMLFGSEDKSGFLNEKYAELKVKDLLGDTFKAVQGLGKDGTLEDLNEISPKVGVIVGNLLKKTEKFSLGLNKETIMSKTMKELPKYLGDTVKAAPLGDMLDGLGKGGDPLLMAVSYGEEGVDYKLDSNGDVVMLNGATKTTINDLIAKGGIDKILNKLTLDSVMTVDLEDTVMCAIAYGSSNRYKKGADGKAEMTQVTYTLEDKGDGAKLYDDKDAVVAITNAETVSATVQKITLASGEVQYVSFNVDGVGLAYSDEALTTPVLYKKTKIGDLTNDSMAVINNIYLKDALSVDAKQHKVLISLAYGEEGVDFEYVGEGEGKTIQMIDPAKPRTIGELRSRGGNLINEIPLSDIMSADHDNALVMYLLYGKKDIHYALDGENVVMQQKRIALIGDVVYNEYGEQITGSVNSGVYTDASGNQYAYDPSTVIDTIETKDGTANVYYLTDMAGNPVKYSKTVLGDMAGSDNVITSLTKRITVGEVMDEETLNSNKFLKHVKDETIDTLPSAIDKLTIQTVFEDDIFYKNASGQFTDKNGNVVADKADATKHEWWYLLHDEEVCKNEHGAGRDKQCIQDYSITQMTVLIDNMRTNIEAATLNQLKADGMINQLDDEALEKPIKKEVAGISFETQFNTVFTDPETQAKTKLGEFTVVEMLQYVNIIIGLI